MGDNLGSSLMLTTIYYTMMVGYLKKRVGSAKGGEMNRFMKYVLCVCVCVNGKEKSSNKPWRVYSKVVQDV